MKIIGLTGGIGSGKSTLLNWFSNQGIPCYDADASGRRLIEGPLKNKIIEEFGKAYLHSDGSINRKKLGDFVFANTSALKTLNNIVHPAVDKDFKNFVNENSQVDLIIKEAAILFESGASKDCDAVIYVTSPEDVRIQRVMERDKVDKISVLARINQQWPEAKKRKIADYVIENRYIEHTFSQAAQILDELLSQNRD
ncbi:MAG: dephospho-CoA kinase [Flavobacteriaceae bacterium]